MKTQIKKLAVTFSIFAAASFAKAQVSFTGGIAAGVSTGAVEISDIGNGFTNVIKGQNIYGFELGIYAKPKLGPFYAKPELLYKFSSGQVSYSDQSGTSRSDNFQVHKLEIPVLFGYNFLGPVSIEAGPVYYYMLGITQNYDQNQVELGKSGLGYRIGAGLDFGKVVFSFHYQGVAGNSSGNATYKAPYELIFGVGIRMGGL